jgi:hypothetical protein
MLYFPAILLVALGLVTLILTWGAPQPYGVLVAVACLIIAFVLAVRAWWKRWTTEIFVTDRRVIFVHGFFDRQSLEVHMNQIESVDVDQTLLGPIAVFSRPTDFPCRTFLFATTSRLQTISQSSALTRAMASVRW